MNKKGLSILRYFGKLSEARLLSILNPKRDQSTESNNIISAEESSLLEVVAADSKQLLESQSADDANDLLKAGSIAHGHQISKKAEGDYDYYEKQILKAAEKDFYVDKVECKENETIFVKFDFGDYNATILVVNMRPEDYPSSKVGEYTEFKKRLVGVQVLPKEADFPKWVVDAIEHLLKQSDYVDYVLEKKTQPADSLALRHAEADLPIFMKYKELISASEVICNDENSLMKINGVDVPFGRSSFDFTLNDFNAAISPDDPTWFGPDIKELKNIFQVELEFRAKSLGLQNTVDKELVSNLIKTCEDALGSKITLDEDDDGYQIYYTENRIGFDNELEFSARRYLGDNDFSGSAMPTLDAVKTALDVKISEIINQSEFDRKRIEIVESLADLHNSILNDIGLVPYMELIPDENNNSFSVRVCCGNFDRNIENKDHGTTLLSIAEIQQNRFSLIENQIQDAIRSPIVSERKLNSFESSPSHKL